jgi:hypothetical protein
MTRQIQLPSLASLAITTFMTALVPAQVLAADRSQPVPGWIVVPIVFVAFVVLIYALSRVVHRDPCLDRTMREEAGDKPLTPVPGDGGFGLH